MVGPVLRKEKTFLPAHLVSPSRIASSGELAPSHGDSGPELAPTAQVPPDAGGRVVFAVRPCLRGRQFRVCEAPGKEGPARRGAAGPGHGYEDILHSV